MIHMACEPAFWRDVGFVGVVAIYWGCLGWGGVISCINRCS